MVAGIAWPTTTIIHGLVAQFSQVYRTAAKEHRAVGVAQRSAVVSAVENCISSIIGGVVVSLLGITLALENPPTREVRAGVIRRNRCDQNTGALLLAGAAVSASRAALVMSGTVQLAGRVRAASHFRWSPSAGTGLNQLFLRPGPIRRTSEYTIDPGATSR